MLRFFVCSQERVRRRLWATERRADIRATEDNNVEATRGREDQIEIQRIKEWSKAVRARQKHRRGAAGARDGKFA